MALTKEEGVRAGMILLSPGNWGKVKFVDSQRTLEAFLNLYEKDKREAVGDGISWRRCANFLRTCDFEVNEDHFEEHYDYDDHSEFFDTMFQTMLCPPISKPLEDWL